MKKQRMILLLGVVLAGCLFSGCVSSRRAMRLSPLSGDMPDSGAVNLWPFYQRSGGSGSILWPLIDFDGQGFSVRPVFVKDDAEYSVLFPLSAWNRFGGWVGNGYWTDSGTFGMWPLFHKSDDFCYAAPVWFRRSGAAWGMFPIVWHTPESFAVLPFWKTRAGSWGMFPIAWRYPGEFNLLGPVWWREGGSGSWGVFPIAWRYPGEFNLLGPVWWREGGSGSCGIFPVAWYLNSGFRSVLPVWWWNDASAFGVFPIFWKNDDFYMCFPLYSQGRDWLQVGPYWAKDGARGIFPVFWKWTDGNAVFPLYRYESRAPGDFELNLLGPVFNWRQECGQLRHFACLWPLITWESGNLTCWPFYSDSMDSPLILYGRSKKELGAETALPTWRNSSWRDGVWGGFGLWRSQLKGERYFEAETEEEEPALNELARLLLKKLPYEAENAEKIEEKLQSLKIERAVPKDPKELEALQVLLLERFVYEREEYNAWLLAGILWRERAARSMKYGTEWGPWERNASVLGGLYKIRENGESRQTSIFPFISVYEEPGKSGWSFGAGMFRRETVGGNTSGSIFFIPY